MVYEKKKKSEDNYSSLASLAVWERKIFQFYKEKRERNCSIYYIFGFKIITVATANDHFLYD